MGKYVLYGTVAFIVLVIGMLVYPTVHTMISAAPVTGFTDLEKASMVILSYFFLFLIVYVIWVHVKR